MSPTNTRTYRVRTQSGQWGWRSRLRVQYATREDFANWDDAYNLAERLGYSSPGEAWKANPVIEGSTNPGDYRRVSA